MVRSESRVSRDVYANLLRDTRGLRREQSTARDAWFDALPWEGKEDSLFELEMLLKGLVCFGNSLNHPGPPRRGPPAAHDFTEETRVLRDAGARAVTLTRELLGDRDRAYAFTQYLEHVLPEDAERTRLINEQLTQDTPQEALFVLRNAFTAHEAIAEGLLRTGRISHRLHAALHGTMTREIARNVFFNPLVSLEFRPEYDRIRTTEILEALEHTPTESGHRVVALTFLTLCRLLRYLALVDNYASDDSNARLAYTILAAFRSDSRALTRFVAGGAPDLMADGFEREVMAVQATAIRPAFTDLAAVAAGLVSLRGTLLGLATVLRIEVRRTFERDLPAAPDSNMETGPQIVVASANLRAAVHHAILSLCAELRPGAEPPVLGGQAPAKRPASERLRRDVWMFGQILRAFLAKARAAPTQPDEWAAQASFKFVREFLGHFRAIGYQLLRESDYSRLDPFLETLEKLRDADLLEEERLRRAVDESVALQAFLEELFRQVSRRAELADVAFDKKEAAATLRVYLGAA